MTGQQGKALLSLHFTANLVEPLYVSTELRFNICNLTILKYKVTNVSNVGGGEEPYSLTNPV